MNPLDVVKDQLRGILAGKPHALSPLFAEQVRHCLDIDSLPQMHTALQSLLRGFTFVNMGQAKQELLDCIQFIMNSEQND